MFRLTPNIKYFIAFNTVTCCSEYMYYQDAKFVPFYNNLKRVSRMYDMYIEEIDRKQIKYEGVKDLNALKGLYNADVLILYTNITYHIDENSTFETFADWAIALTKGNDIASKLNKQEKLLRYIVFKMIDVVMKSKSKEDLEKLCNFIGFEDAFYTCLYMDRERVLFASNIPIWASMEACLKNPEWKIVTIDPRYMYVIENNEHFNKQYRHLVDEIDYAYLSDPEDDSDL